MYTSYLRGFFSIHGVHLSDFMSVSVSMHACISLSCDWLNDFLKGYSAAISFWHLITVRSHCAPADPLWYGPCTRPSPLSQVPIIIIKPPPLGPTLSTPLRVQQLHRGRGEFNLVPVLSDGPYYLTPDDNSWQLALLTAILKYFFIQWNYTMTVRSNGFRWQGISPPLQTHFCLCGKSNGSPGKGYSFQKKAKGKRWKVNLVSRSHELLAAHYIQRMAGSDTALFWDELLTSLLCPMELVSVKPMTATQKSNWTKDQIRATGAKGHLTFNESS